jgi:DUF1680 family protein
MTIVSAAAIITYALVPKQPDPDMKVEIKVPIKTYAFDLRQVRLLDGPFKHAMQKDGEYLLYLEPDRLLAWFRKDAGLKPKAEVYGGWETQGIAGHSLGHYLTACALMYASTGDDRFKKKVDYIVDEMQIIQATNGNGYIAAIPEGRRVFKEIHEGKIETQNFNLNGVWVPWYTLHKQLMGLVDVYYYCGNRKALDVGIKLADWICWFCDKLTDEQMQRMMRCEHGGINEALANVYAMTGNEKYLKCAQKFYHKAVMDPLSKSEDCLPGLHANTQVPKLIGLARLYELTGNKTYHDAASYFWDTVVHNHSYVIGGNSNHEYFGPPGKLNDRLSERTTETCNTYNMLKLTQHLFAWKDDAEYMDYYERALYNHILASQNPEDGMMAYCVPLNTGGRKRYSNRDRSFWCCVGTGIENHAKYGAAIYSHGPGTLYVNLFIPSVLTWKEEGITVKQETAFPAEDTVKITVTCAEPEDGTLAVRHPAWAKGILEVKINGKKIAVDSKPGTYARITRTWNSGDMVTIKLPMSLYTEAMPDNPKRIALLYGPLVLAGDLGGEGERVPDPVLVKEDKPLEQWLLPVSGKKLTYKTKGVAFPKDLVVKPFYQLYDTPYIVYWDEFTPAEWKKKEEEYKAEQQRIKELEARSLDVMRLGEMQPERDHNFKDENSRASEDDGNKWRGAFNNGWFSFEMKVLPDAPTDLMVRYRGSSRRRRTRFDILIDGEVLVTESLRDEKPNEFYYKTYQLPEKMTKGKDKVTVMFKAHERRGTGRIFGCLTVKRTEEK